MTHSLYTKFVLGYLLFGLLGFVLIATFSSHMTHEYLVRERSDAMYDEANLLASTYSDIYQGKTISLDTANPQLEAVSTYLGASAWVLDHKGAVVAETSPASHSGKTIEGFDPTVTGNKSYIIGDFFGMFPGETLSVLAPITGNFNTYGYVVLHMPMERILDSQNQILNIVYITAAIIFFLSLIILLVFTRTVYFPLKKITAGAMEYAGGNLDHTIKVKTNDEMGYLADTLNYMSSELGKMEEYQKSFIANVSHDFRSPLTSIKGFIETLQQGAIDDKEMARKFLNIIAEEADRLYRLINDVLSLSSMEAGRVRAPTARLSLGQAAQEACLFLKKAAEDKQIDLQVEEDGDGFIQANNDHVKQLLINLIDNAIKYTLNGGKVWVRVQREADQVVLRVKDTGIGIAPEHQSRVFERFYRGQNAAPQSAGIGLALARMIITAQNGTIQASNRREGGARFTIRFYKQSAPPAP